MPFHMCAQYIEMLSSKAWKRYLIICDKPMYKAFKKPILRRYMPQFSTKLLNNIMPDLQQSKSFHRR